MFNNKNKNREEIALYGSKQKICHNFSLELLFSYFIELNQRQLILFPFFCLVCKSTCAFKRYNSSCKTVENKDIRYTMRHALRCATCHKYVSVREIPLNRE